MKKFFDKKTIIILLVCLLVIPNLSDILYEVRYMFSHSDSSTNGAGFDFSSDDYSSYDSYSYEGTSSEKSDYTVTSNDISLDVSDYKNAEQEARDIIKENNGMINNSSVDDSKHNSYYRVYFDVSIPEESYNSFIESIEGVGEVTNKSTYSYDIKDAYLNSEDYIKYCSDRIERYKSLMEQEDITTSELIELEDRLFELENEYHNALFKQNDRTKDLNYIDVSIELIEDKPIIIHAFTEAIDNISVDLETYFGLFFLLFMLFPIALVGLLLWTVLVKIKRALWGILFDEVKPIKEQGGINNEKIE